MQLLSRVPLGCITKPLAQQIPLNPWRYSYQPTPITINFCECVTLTQAEYFSVYSCLSAKSCQAVPRSAWAVYQPLYRNLKVFVQVSSGTSSSSVQSSLSKYLVSLASLSLCVRLHTRDTEAGILQVFFGCYFIYDKVHKML